MGSNNGIQRRHNLRPQDHISILIFLKVHNVQPAGALVFAGFRVRLASREPDMDDVQSPSGGPVIRVWITGLCIHAVTRSAAKHLFGHEIACARETLERHRNVKALTHDHGIVHRIQNHRRIRV